MTTVSIFKDKLKKEFKLMIDNIPKQFLDFQ